MLLTFKFHCTETDSGQLLLLGNQDSEAARVPGCRSGFLAQVFAKMWRLQNVRLQHRMEPPHCTHVDRIRMEWAVV